MRLTLVVGVTAVAFAGMAAVGGAANLHALHGLANIISLSGGGNTPADDQYVVKVKCNSGRGNLSETNLGTHQTNSNTLINPHTGGTGPGLSPTDDCDPGNSGPHNSGGD
jgi:hypothetical protein